VWIDKNKIRKKFPVFDCCVVWGKFVSHRIMDTVLHRECTRKQVYTVRQFNSGVLEDVLTCCPSPR
jgi:hypothetical protein